MDQQMLMGTYQRMSPKGQACIERLASERGVDVEDVMLDEMLEAAGPLRDQLFSLKRERTLHSV